MANRQIIQKLYQTTLTKIRNNNDTVKLAGTDLKKRWQTSMIKYI